MTLLPLLRAAALSCFPELSSMADPYRLTPFLLGRLRPPFLELRSPGVTSAGVSAFWDGMILERWRGYS